MSVKNTKEEQNGGSVFTQKLPGESVLALRKLHFTVSAAWFVVLTSHSPF